MNYRLTDLVADPPGDSDALHTEALVRLPGCFLCYTPVVGSPECSQAPVEHNQFITFGSFNVLAKLSDECIETWSKILKQVKDSRLVLKSAGLEDPITRDYIRQKFMKHDIDEKRLKMIQRTHDISTHLEQYNLLDISLDTFPYNGTTTTCESLWMGVPVISLRGNRHAGRVSASLLTQLELSELVASHTEQYIAIAQHLAEDRYRINKYRGSLRSRIAGSPLCDGPGFTRSLEKAFSKMVECDQKSVP
jgi:predicted O-linked N-acetylglucosamine transferase (SPINDLY family)